LIKASAKRSLFPPRRGLPVNTNISFAIASSIFLLSFFYYEKIRPVLAGRILVCLKFPA
jgi:hypothetical protein